MSLVKVSSKYQIVIPLRVREALHIRPGEEFEILAVDGVLQVVRSSPPVDLFGWLGDIDTGSERDEADRI